MNDKLHRDMVDKVNRSADDAERIGVSGGTSSDRSRVASRRYVLLKGVGRGSAILATAAVPIKTLASTPSMTANGQICTISGVQSGAHSQATQLLTCAGLKPAYYADIKKWPNYSPTTNPQAKNAVGGTDFDENSKFSDVFGSGSNHQLLFLLNKDSSSAESHWIAALLNAIKPPPSYVFPYSPGEVVDLYKSVQQSAALDFFKGWMETIAS